MNKHSSDPSLIYCYGEVLSELGRKLDALLMFKRAYELDIGNSTVKETIINFKY